MSLVVTLTKVKEKARLTDSSLDSVVSSLIGEWVPVLEFAIEPSALNDTGNAGLQATLNLGATEAVAGELLAQLDREEGAVERFVFAFFEIGGQRGPAIDPSGLKAQGYARLAPYLKRPESLSGTLGVAAGGSRTGEEE
jgi:hypothetical protein